MPEGDTLCGPEFKEAPTEVRKQRKSVAGIPAETGGSKHGSAKGRVTFEDLKEDLIQELNITLKIMVCI